MKTTLARVTRDGQSPKFISGAGNYQGFLVSVRQKGAGKIIRTEAWTNGFDDAGEEDIYERYEEAYQPYFDNNKVSESGIDREEFKKKYGQSDIREILGTDAEKCLIRWGQGDGILVEDGEIVKKREKKAKEEQRDAKILEETGFVFTLEKKTWFEDEDGKSPCYHYLLTHQQTGKVFHFMDRNIFDVGRAINPAYSIHPDWGEGGLIHSVPTKTEKVYLDADTLKKMEDEKMPGHYAHLLYDNTVRINYDGQYYGHHEKDAKGGVELEVAIEVEFWWQSYNEKTGWVPVRKIDDIELQAYRLVEKYGQADGGIRM